MIQFGKVYTWLIVILIISMPTGMNSDFKIFGGGYTDELMTLVFLGIAFLDCLVNGRWKSYVTLWLTFAAILFYTIYSKYSLNFNKTPYILLDAFIEGKPYIAFAALAGSGLTLKDFNLKLIKTAGAVVATFMSIVFVCQLYLYVSGHPASAGITLYCAVIVYLLAAAVDRDKPWSKRDLILVTIWLTCGLLCTRAKYFAEYTITIFFIFLYKPYFTKAISAKHIAIFTLLIVAIFAVTWQKFSYYYITGTSETFDPNASASFARPALYGAGALILFDYFPFGSGLASFACYASAVNYSSLYYEYQLDKIYGLSPSYYDFICDAFYPSLAQFGIVGLILFIVFWRRVYKQGLKLLHTNNAYLQKLFILCALLLTTTLIESTSDTMFTAYSGFMTMTIIGLIVSVSKTCTTQQVPTTTSNETIKRIKI
jgi:hypothetical protein